MLTDEGYGYLPITEVDLATLGTFSCGKPRLDDFLSAQALALHKARLGFTNVVFHQQFEGPVSYFMQSGTTHIEAHPHQPALPRVALASSCLTD